MPAAFYLFSNELFPNERAEASPRKESAFRRGTFFIEASPLTDTKPGF
jgi:hypothetical protein